MIVRDDVLAGIRLLPGLPAVAARLAVLMRDKDVDINLLVEVVQYDPALTARVIKVANSASHAGERLVSNLRDALVRVGLAELYHIVFVSSLSPVMQRPVEGYELASGQLWRHCVATALGADIIEQLIGKEQGGVAFTAGLLHDIGKLVLGDVAEERFAKVESKADTRDTAFDEAEFEVLGIDHTEAGALVLGQWGFPQELIEVVRCHHSPENAVVNPDLTALVHVADMVAMMMGVGLGRDALGYKASAGAMSRLGLTRESLELIACRMLGRLEEVQNQFPGMRA